MGELPKISILIAVDDHPPDLDRFFAALTGQTLPPVDYEVILIDASLTDDYGPAYERAMASKRAGLRLHYERMEKGSRARSLNRGLQLARAPLVLFLAHDSLATPRITDTHIRFHEQNPERHKVGIGSMIFSKTFRTHFSAWLEGSGELFGVPFSDDMNSVPKKFLLRRQCIGQAEFFARSRSVR